MRRIRKRRGGCRVGICRKRRLFVDGVADGGEAAVVAAGPALDVAVGLEFVDEAVGEIAAAWGGGDEVFEVDAPVVGFGEEVGEEATGGPGEAGVFEGGAADLGVGVVAVLGAADDGGCAWGAAAGCHGASCAGFMGFSRFDVRMRGANVP
jgi:hypothetical protein